MANNGTTNGALLELRNVSRYYGRGAKRFIAVQNVNL